jgi:phytoene dehydrogenase-like protein
MGNDGTKDASGEWDAVVVGAGLSGLACATELVRHGHRVLVLEASDGVGGRVRTDTVDGFRLDRGFQVLLTAYETAAEMLDYAALDLRRFQPGALIRTRGRFTRLFDPVRQPTKALPTLASRAGSLADKLRVARLRARLARASLASVFAAPDTTTLAALREEGFSDRMIETFFRPFFGGIFLDDTLSTSRRMFEFVFRTFARGYAALPAAGMQAIPEQLAARLPTTSLRLNAPVRAARAGEVELESGEVVHAKAVVVAAHPREAHRLLGRDPRPPMQGVTCLYFAAKAPPVRGPVLVLGGDRGGIINNLCVPSELSRAYAPEGRALVSVSVLGAGHDLEVVEQKVRSELVAWFGPDARTYELLRTYVLPDALPSQPPGALEPRSRKAQVAEGLYVCGDHLETASIEGALRSGRAAAEQIHATLTPPARGRRSLHTATAAAE